MSVIEYYERIAVGNKEFPKGTIARAKKGRIRSRHGYIIFPEDSPRLWKKLEYTGESDDVLMKVTGTGKVTDGKPPCEYDELLKFQQKTQEKIMKIDIKTNVTTVMGRDSDKLTLESLISNLRTQMDYIKGMEELGLDVEKATADAETLREIIKKRQKESGDV